MQTRSIGVETDVYAAIWARHQPGDNSENDILRRELGVKSAVSTAASPTATALSAKIGFSDPRFDINLREGLEIFRNYKGKEYRAKAISQQWMRTDTGISYPSLNRLSKSVSGNVENAWRNWYFMGTDGKRHLIEGLRNDIHPSVRHLL